jgi:hypothetical protein
MDYRVPGNTQNEKQSQRTSQIGSRQSKNLHLRNCKKKYLPNWRDCSDL